MQFSDRRLGEYRIYAGALESGQDGYTAGLVVMHERPGRRPQPRFREDALAGGYCWPSAEQAMSYALARGAEMVRSRRFDVALAEPTAG